MRLHRYSSTLVALCVALGATGCDSSPSDLEAGARQGRTPPLDPEDQGEEPDQGSSETGAPTPDQGSSETGAPTPDASPLDGCTRTRGYWQTHHQEGIAQEQPWPIPETTELCGIPWVEILWTPASGDPWTILAAQWIAASLNVESGAQAPAEVATALEDGRAILESCGEGDAAESLELADLLDRFNNGLEGVPHCDDVPDTGTSGEVDSTGGEADSTGGDGCVTDPEGVTWCDSGPIVPVG